MQYCLSLLLFNSLVFFVTYCWSDQMKRMRWAGHAACTIEKRNTRFLGKIVLKWIWNCSLEWFVMSNFYCAYFFINCVINSDLTVHNSLFSSELICFGTGTSGGLLWEHASEHLCSIKAGNFMITWGLFGLSGRDCA